MTKNNKLIVAMTSFILLTLLLVGCTPSKFFKYELDNIEKIGLYSTEDTGLKLDLEITDETKIEAILNKLSNIAYTRYYGDIKAKSDYTIRIYFGETTYDEIDPYRILKYKNGKIDRNLKYQCSIESFETLYSFASK